jgi:hypothetical protein
MEITTYRRHAVDCKHKDDRYHARAVAPSGFSSTGRNRTRRWTVTSFAVGRTSGLPRPASGRKPRRKLSGLTLTSKPYCKASVRHNVTVKAAMDEWLEFRSKNGLDNTKADLMGGKLTEWCEKNDVVLLSAITTERAMNIAGKACQQSALYRDNLARDHVLFTSAVQRSGE